MTQIFLSYNRQDLETAKMFSDAFEAAGLSVWQDLTSLRVGDVYDVKTENALKTASAVVVLWSQRSVASEWVRAEAIVARRNGTLVPVMIEDCERPIMFEIFQTADLTKWRGQTDDKEWQTLLEDVRQFVTKSDRSVDLQITQQFTGSIDKYSVQSFSDIMQGGRSLNWIASQVDNVVDHFPVPEIAGNDFGSSEKWFRIYEQSPESGYALLLKNSTIVGYWHCVPVQSNFYERILTGENINSAIEIKNLDTFSFPGDYDIYFVDLFLLPEHKNAMTVRLMINSFTSFLKQLASVDIFANRISAHISSEMAEEFCRKLGFKFITHHQCHEIYDDDGKLVPTKIFELDIRRSLLSKLFSMDEALMTSYRAHFESCPN